MHLPVTSHSTSTTRRRGVVLALATVTVAALAATSAPAAVAASAPAEKPVALKGKLRFAKIPMRTDGKPTAAAAAAIVPLRTFSGSLTINAQTFPYDMVGSDPAGAAVTSTIPNSLTAINFKFSNGTMSTPASITTNVVSSGLFQNKTFQSVNGQYLDVYSRTNFWTAINNGAKNWHVRMAQPTVRPALNMTIPANKGRTVLLTTGIRIGVLDITYLDQHLKTYVNTPAANSFTQLVGLNIILCNGNPTASLNNCGIGGYHSAWSTSTGKHTYAYSGYLSRLVFNDPTAANIAIMSHEMGEWQSDPYTTNVIPAWDMDPTAAGVACNTLLENGDGLEGKGLQIGSFFYQDLHYLPYFSREIPSTSWAGRYSWFGNNKGPAVLC